MKTTRLWRNSLRACFTLTLLLMMLTPPSSTSTLHTLFTLINSTLKAFPNIISKLLKWKQQWKLFMNQPTILFCLHSFFVRKWNSLGILCNWSYCDIICICWVFTSISVCRYPFSRYPLLIAFSFSNSQMFDRSCQSLLNESIITTHMKYESATRDHKLPCIGFAVQDC